LNVVFYNPIAKRMQIFQSNRTRMAAARLANRLEFLYANVLESTQSYLCGMNNAPI